MEFSLKQEVDPLYGLIQTIRKNVLIDLYTFPLSAVGRLQIGCQTEYLLSKDEDSHTNRQKSKN